MNNTNKQIQPKILKLPVTEITITIPENTEVSLNSLEPDSHGVCEITRVSGGYRFGTEEWEESPMRIHIKTGVKRTGDSLFDLYAEAHEEGHILDALGGRDIIEGRLKKFDLSSPHPYSKEVFADSVAVLTLLERGYSIEKIFTLIKNYCGSSDYAFRLFHFLQLRYL